jgi:Prenyltransferase and squalene oxidase repeat
MQVFITSRLCRPTKEVTDRHQVVKLRVRCRSLLRSCSRCLHAGIDSRVCSGGPTYLAIATLRLAPRQPSSEASWNLTPSEHRQTLRWLIQNQDRSGGFRGRTNKEADACYCFWCGAAIEVSNSAACFFFLSFFFSGLSELLPYINAHSCRF